MLLTLAIIGLRFGWMLGSTVLVETVFDWPGIGLYAAQSALYSDFKPVIGVTLMIGFCFMVINFLLDLNAGWLDTSLRQQCLQTTCIHPTHQPTHPGDTGMPTPCGNGPPRPNCSAPPSP